MQYNRCSHSFRYCMPLLLVLFGLYVVEHNNGLNVVPVIQKILSNIQMSRPEAFEEIQVDPKYHTSVYINSTPTYTHRLKPSYYEDTPNTFQMDTYIVAEELARRFGCKYIIDIGCGKGSKTAMMSKEFNVIGVDYKVNLVGARKAFPHLTFIDANLDIGHECHPLNISLDILKQAIVMSADVIEHIIDPFYCYLRLLKYMSKFSPAVVVSSPDRIKFFYAGDYYKPHGPPFNTAHVREWKVEEITFLFSDIGMVPLFSSWMCFAYNKCPQGYTPEQKTQMMNWVVVMGNNNLWPKWKSRLSELAKVTAFIVVYPKTNELLAEYNIASLIKQSISVILFILPNAPKLKLDSVRSINVSDISNVTKYIAAEVNKDKYKEGDWFMVQGAHDTINITWPNMEDVKLHELLTQVSKDPHKFNAVALTTVFLHNASGVAYDSTMPIRLGGPGPWDNGSLKGFKPIVNTSEDRIRIWMKSKQTSSIHFVIKQTNSTGKQITDVGFDGRRIYPFHLVNVRAHPEQQPQHKVKFDRAFKVLYGMAFSLGYMPNTRVRSLETDLLY